MTLNLHEFYLLFLSDLLCNLMCIPSSPGRLFMHILSFKSLRPGVGGIARLVPVFTLLVRSRVRSFRYHR